MAGFFDNVLKGFLGSDYLKDYRHASKTFRSAGYANAPRLKYLFHVYFNINTTEIPGLTKLFGARDSSRISVLTKSVQLPNYTFDVYTMNQYNRKRNIQTKINYEPVQVDFHDDSSDIVRSLWFAYYNYFYKDPSQAYGGNQSTQSTNTGAGGALSNLVNGLIPNDISNILPSGGLDGLFGGSKGAGSSRGNGADQNLRDIYENDRIGNDWGYMGEGVGGATNKPQFFKDITVYGFNQHSFVSYTLVNPIITDFRHDTYDYSAGGDTMSNSMTIKYESVKYGSGAIGTSQVPGFASPEYYDNEPSALSRPGSTNSFFGQGGILDAGVGAFEDLSSGNLLGAAVKGARAVYTYNKMESPSDTFKEEVNQETRNVISSTTGRESTGGGPFSFSSPKRGKAPTRAEVISQRAGSLAPVTQGTPTATTSSRATSNGQNIGIASAMAVDLEADLITNQEEINNPPGDWPEGTVLERRTTLEDVDLSAGAIAAANSRGGVGAAGVSGTVGRLIRQDVYIRPDGTRYVATPEVSENIDLDAKTIMAIKNNPNSQVKLKTANSPVTPGLLSEADTKVQATVKTTNTIN